MFNCYITFSLAWYITYVIYAALVCYVTKVVCFIKYMLYHVSQLSRCCDYGNSEYHHSRPNAGKTGVLQIRVIKMLLAAMMMMTILCSKGHGPMAPQWARRDHGTQGQPSPWSAKPFEITPRHPGSPAAARPGSGTRIRRVEAQAHWRAGLGLTGTAGRDRDLASDSPGPARHRDWSGWQTVNLNLTGCLAWAWAALAAQAGTVTVAWAYPSESG